VDSNVGVRAYYLRGQLTLLVSNGNHALVLSSNVGARAFYLRGRLAVLEQELIEWFSTELTQRGFNLVLAPEMFKAPVVVRGRLAGGNCIYGVKCTKRTLLALSLIYLVVC